jgi:hypothetical protein
MRPKNDEIGIVVGSLGVDQRVYLREDLSIVGSPEVWGKRAVAAYHAYSADHILAEANYGGDMVAYVIRSIDASVPVKIVRASVGKHIRAEPVSALYEKRRDAIRHVGLFPKLEDQLTKFTTLGYEGSRSPDRADAWIWAVSDLALASGAHSWLEYYRKLAEESQSHEAVRVKAGPQFPYEIGKSSSSLRGHYALPGLIKLKAPDPCPSTVYGMDGSKYVMDVEGILYVPEEDAVALTRVGWQRVTGVNLS